MNNDFHNLVEMKCKCYYSILSFFTLFNKLKCLFWILMNLLWILMKFVTQVYTIKLHKLVGSKHEKMRRVEALNIFKEGPKKKKYFFNFSQKWLVLFLFEFWINRIEVIKVTKKVFMCENLWSWVLAQSMILPDFWGFFFSFRILPE